MASEVSPFPSCCAMALSGWTMQYSLTRSPASDNLQARSQCVQQQWQQWRHDKYFNCPISQSTQSDVSSRSGDNSVVEHWTREWKVTGSSPGSSSRWTDFSSVNFLCRLFFSASEPPPRVTAVACKESQLFCQKCRKSDLQFSVDDVNKKSTWRCEHARSGVELFMPHTSFSSTRSFIQSAWLI